MQLQVYAADAVAVKYTLHQAPLNKQNVCYAHSLCLIESTLLTFVVHHTQNLHK